MKIIYKLLLLILLNIQLVLIADAQIQRMGLPAPDKIELRSSEVSIPMKSFGNRPVVELKINNKGPFKFILDTGAAGTVLTQSLADELKLSVIGEARVGSPVGTSTQPGKFVRLEQLEIGNFSVTGMSAVSIDLSQMLTGTDAPRGILSAALFAGYLLTLDYPQNRIVIRPGAIPAADGKEIFEFDSAQRLPTISISVAGVDIKVHIDSGSPGGITLPKKFSEQLLLKSKLVEAGKSRTVNAESRIWVAKLDGTVKLGRYVFKDPELRFNESTTSVGNIGYELLRKFAITLDKKNNRLRFEG